MTHYYRAVLKTPVLNSLPTLDALILNQLTQHFDGDYKKAKLISKSIIYCKDKLYHCSSAIIENPEKCSYSFIASLRLRNDFSSDGVVIKNHRHEKIDEARARTYGSKLDKYSGLTGTSVYWFFDGDVGAVNNIMEQVLFIGKKSSHGFGQLGQRESWKSRCSYLGVDNEPLRPIPKSLYKGNQPTIGATWKPAYWDLNNSAECVIPVQRYSSELIGRMV